MALASGHQDKAFRVQELMPEDKSVATHIERCGKLALAERKKEVGNLLSSL